MAQERTPTVEETQAAERAARESSPLPWSAPAYFNVAVDPAPQHGANRAIRVAAVAYGGSLYQSDYGPISTPIEDGFTRRVNGRASDGN